jgi:SAM-dependent methyltransferase
MAAALKANQADDIGESKLVTLDVCDVNESPDSYWKKVGLPRSPRANIKEIGAANFVDFVEVGSLEYFDRHADEFDFIFLDGDHAAPTVYQELPMALRHLRQGGTILLHDFFPGQRPLWSNSAVVPGPSLAVERYQAEGSAVRALPLGSLPWSTKMGSNVTSLALLTQ